MTRPFVFTGEQSAAVTHTLDRHCHQKLIAGPGSGKTTTLLGRVLHLIDQGAQPEKILVLAFNRSIKNEFQRKLELMLGHRSRYGLPEVRTINSWGNKLCFEFMMTDPSPILQMNGPPNSEEDLSKLLKGVFAGGVYRNRGLRINENGEETVLKASELFKQLPDLEFSVVKIKTPKVNDPDFAGGEYRSEAEKSRVQSSLFPAPDSMRLVEVGCDILLGYRNLLGTIDDYYDRCPEDIDSETWQIFFATLKEIDRYLNKQGVVFYQDQLYKAAKSLSNSQRLREYLADKYHYMVVDEYQDVSEVSHFLIISACAHNCQLNAVGDPRQAIFEFAGSDPDLLINGINESLGNVTTRYLKQSFRFGKKIANIANRIGSPLMMAGENVNDDNWDYMFDDYNPQAGAQLSEVIGAGQPGTVQRIVAPEDLGALLRARVDQGVSPVVVVRTHEQKVKAEQVLIKTGVPYQLNLGISDYALQFVSETVEFVIHCWATKSINFSLQPSFWRHYEGDRLNLAAKPTWAEPVNFQVMSMANALLAKRKLKAVMPSEFVFQVYDEYLDELLEQAAKGISNYVKEKLTRYEAGEKAVKEIVKPFVEKITAKELFGTTTAKVTVEVAHAIKGLEYETVVIFECVEGYFPFVRSSIQLDSDDVPLILNDKRYVDSERRLAFVAATRAKQELVLYIPEGCTESRYTTR